MNFIILVFIILTNNFENMGKREIGLKLPRDFGDEILGNGMMYHV